ncbi:MAG: protease inhibitor I42 family protein [Patescibacteria group bacterium]
MKRLIFCLVPLLLAGGCALVSTLPQITLKDHRQNFDFPIGQQFKVVLPSNQSTGYQWQVTDITAGVLERVDNTYQVTDKYNTENLVGAGGEEVWTFKVLKVERSHIVMKYLRPWDKTDVANEFLVTINGNPGDDGLLTYIGVIKSTPEGAQFDDYFVADTGETFGIESVMQNKIADPGVKAKIVDVTDKDIKVEIRGTLTADAIDYEGKQFVISEIAEKS